MNKLKIMQVYAKDFQVGDLVLNKPKDKVYLIMAKEESWLHNHIYFRCYFPSHDSHQKFCLCDFSGKRTVVRIIDN